MAWGSKITATQLRESAHCRVEVDFPASPTDDAVISVYGSLDGTAWSATPLMALVLDKDSTRTRSTSSSPASTSSGSGSSARARPTRLPAPTSLSARTA